MLRSFAVNVMIIDNLYIYRLCCADDIKSYFLGSTYINISYLLNTLIFVKIFHALQVLSVVKSCVHWIEQTHHMKYGW